MGKDGKPDSWFLFDSYKRKQNLVTKVQEPVPEMSLISHQTYKILHKNAENIYLYNMLPIYSEIISKISDFIKK